MGWVDWTMTVVCAFIVHDAIIRAAYIVRNGIIIAGKDKK